MKVDLIKMHPGLMISEKVNGQSVESMLNGMSKLVVVVFEDVHDPNFAQVFDLLYRKSLASRA